MGFVKKIVYELKDKKKGLEQLRTLFNILTSDNGILEVWFSQSHYAMNFMRSFLSSIGFKEVVQIVDDPEYLSGFRAIKKGSNEVLYDE